MLSAMRWMLVLIAIVVFSFGFSTLCETQGLMPTSRTTATPPMSGRYTQQSDTVPISSGMIGDLLPNIPNLQFGFQYFFGNNVRSGQATADYILPVSIGNEAVLFGEAHGNYWNFGQKPPGGASRRVDLSLGGGFRKILADHLLLGVNGFYDSSRLFNQWYSSGSVGLEMAAIMGTSDAFDLNVNWYGNLFASNSILNPFKNKSGSYDIEAGYSHAMLDDSLDLRLKFAGYQFVVVDSVYGYMTGADLTTRDGMFTLRYEYGNDRINGSWNNVGAFVNVGFQMENIIKGESPVTMPEPMFTVPRNLRQMLTQKVKRDWNQRHAPGRAVLAAAAVSGGGGGDTCSFYRTTPDGSVGNGIYNWGSNFIEGPEPYTCLTSGLCAKVTFHWETEEQENHDGGFGVYIQGDTCTRNIAIVTYHQEHSGDVTVWGSQNDFIDNGCSPKSLLIDSSNILGITFSGITITFNSECQRNW